MQKTNITQMEATSLDETKGGKIDIPEGVESLLYSDAALELGYTQFVVGVAETIVPGSYITMVANSEFIAKIPLREILEAKEPIHLFPNDKNFATVNLSFFVVWNYINGLTVQIEKEPLWSKLDRKQLQRVWDYANNLWVPLDREFYNVWAQHMYRTFSRTASADEKQVQDVLDFKQQLDRINSVRQHLQLQPIVLDRNRPEPLVGLVPGRYHNSIKYGAPTPQVPANYTEHNYSQITFPLTGPLMIQVKRLNQSKPIPWEHLRTAPERVGNEVIGVFSVKYFDRISAYAVPGITPELLAEYKHGQPGIVSLHQHTVPVVLYVPILETDTGVQFYQAPQLRWKDHPLGYPVYEAERYWLSSDFPGYLYLRFFIGSEGPAPGWLPVSPEKSEPFARDFFVDSTTTELSIQFPDESEEALESRAIEQWKTLTAEQKAPYVRRGEEEVRCQEWAQAASSYNPRPPIPRQRTPGIPLRPLSPKMYFMQANRDRIQRVNPDISLDELTRLLNEEWEKLSSDQKEPFRAAMKEDAERYKREMKEVKATTKPKQKKIYPNVPKRPLSGYAVYICHNRERVRTAYPEAKSSEITHILAAEWKALARDQKKPYNVESRKNRLLQEEEIAAEEARLASKSEALPIPDKPEPPIQV